MKLLIVEGDRAFNNGIALSFGNDGILQAYTIREAEKLLDSSVELVLLDINLSDENLLREKISRRLEIDAELEIKDQEESREVTEESRNLDS